LFELTKFPWYQPTSFADERSFGDKTVQTSDCSENFFKNQVFIATLKVEKRNAETTKASIPLRRAYAAHM